jgi:hypothetical protein
MAPEDIRWEFDGHLSNRDGWGPSGPMLKRHPTNNGAVAGPIRGRGRLSINEPIKDYAPPQNGINRNFDHVDIPNTESVVTEVNFNQQSDIKKVVRYNCLTVVCSQHRWRGYCPIQICLKSRRQGNC